VKKKTKNEMKRNEYGLFFVVFLIQKTTKENTTEHAQREREDLAKCKKKRTRRRREISLFYEIEIHTHTHTHQR